MSIPPDSDNDLLGGNAVRQLLGGVSEMTVSRWQRDPRIGFPLPDFRLSRRNFWKRSTVEAWLQLHRHASVPTPATPGHPRPASAPKPRAAA